ncbi:MAG: hypothetical protein RL607_2183 [Bacteroidota bacterium]|jgi:Ca-activated chloride channel family protein
MYELESKLYFYGLLLVPLLLGMWWTARRWRRKKEREFAAPELLAYLSPERSPFKSNLKFFLVLFGVVFLIIGLVNPKIGTKVEKVKSRGVDIVFAIDVSKSMLATDVAPNRLEKSKQIVSQLINQLGGDRIGIIAYSGNAFPVLPMTSDYAVAKMFLQSMSPEMISAQGTSIDQAIQLAANRYFSAKDKSNKILVILSDGEDHSNQAVAAAELANEVKMRILTVGVGTENGGPIKINENGTTSYLRDKNGLVVITKRNSKVLEEVAQTGNGGYVDGNSTKAVVDYVKNTINSTEKTELGSALMADFQSQFQWFLGIGLILLFLDVVLWERKTQWLGKMNLFNEKDEVR